MIWGIVDKTCRMWRQWRKSQELSQRTSITLYVLLRNLRIYILLWLMPYKVLCSWQAKLQKEYHWSKRVNVKNYTYMTTGKVQRLRKCCSSKRERSRKNHQQSYGWVLHHCHQLEYFQYECINKQTMWSLTMKIRWYWWHLLKEIMLNGMRYGEQLNYLKHFLIE